MAHSSSLAAAEAIAGTAAPAVSIVSLAIDGYEIGKAAKKDKTVGSTRNTTKAVTTSAAAFGGGLVGASAGALIGTAVFPGVGTIVGGIVGGVGASFGTKFMSRKAADVVMDKVEYDVFEEECDRCGNSFTYNKYESGERFTCDNCLKNK